MKALAHRRQAAFTLIEMLIVIGLIAAIMSIVVVNFGGTSEQAKFQLVETFVESAVAVPLESYKSAHGQYPSTSQGLQSLLQPLPRSQQAPLKKLAEDPWGAPTSIVILDKKTVVVMTSGQLDPMGRATRPMMSAIGSQLF